MYERVFAHLHKTDRLPDWVPLYCSDVYFVKVALEEKFGRPFDIQDVENLLLEEGMLPKGLRSLKGVKTRKYTSG